MTVIKATPKLATVFGGSGFLGRHIVRELAKRGYQVRAAVRRPHLAGYLQPLGNVGQVKAVQANLRHRWSIDRAAEGSDVVINCVGILAETGRQGFNAIQDEGARAIAEAARANNAVMIQVSAIGASEQSPSDYAQSKARGERAVHETIPDAVILRPSIMFGPEDSFFNRFADMARYSPALPLIGGGHTKFQPVFVGDVARAAADAADQTVKGGLVYELGGPNVMTFRECMEEMLRVIDRKRALVTIPWSVARIQASLLGLLPKPLLTTDQVVQLESDNIVSDEAKRDGRTLEGLRIEPQSTDAVLPTYLWRYRRAGQYTRTSRPA